MTGFRTSLVFVAIAVTAASGFEACFEFTPTLVIRLSNEEDIFEKCFLDAYNAQNAVEEKIAETVELIFENEVGEDVASPSNAAREESGEASGEGFGSTDNDSNNEDDEDDEDGDDEDRRQLRKKKSSRKAKATGNCAGGSGCEAESDYMANDECPDCFTRQLLRGGTRSRSLLLSSLLGIVTPPKSLMEIEMNDCVRRKNVITGQLSDFLGGISISSTSC